VSIRSASSASRSSGSSTSPAIFARSRRSLKKTFDRSGPEPAPTMLVDRTT
jgi:hypothetical protein